MSQSPDSRRDRRREHSFEEEEQTETKERIDHKGLQEPSPEELEVQDEVSYEICKEPKFPPTRALFIGNLTRPINSINFQKTLKDLAVPHQVERAWLNRLRTHAIILVSETEGAQILRSKLNGVKYPSEEEDLTFKKEHDLREQEKDSGSPPTQYKIERKPLYIDFIPVKAINQWIFEEDRGPRDGKWKIHFEEKNGEIFASHTLLGGGYVPRYIPPRRGRGGYRGGFGYHGNSYNGNSYNVRRETDSYTPRGSNIDDSRDRYISRDSYAPRGSFRNDYSSRPRSYYDGYSSSRNRDSYAPRDSYEPGKSDRDRERADRTDRDDREPGRDRERERSRSPY